MIGWVWKAEYGRLSVMLLIISNKENFIRAAIMSEMDNTKAILSVHTYSYLYRVTNFIPFIQRLSRFAPQESSKY